MNQPAPEEQIIFLQQIQRLFVEGEFTATYKFALLLSLAELAVEYGDDSGDALPLEMPWVGEKFAELYWRQLAEYSAGLPDTTSGVLHQNHGAQAAVVRSLRTIYRATAGNFSLARVHDAWADTVRAVASTVRTMPLRYQLAACRTFGLLATGHAIIMPVQATEVRHVPLHCHRP
jgi:hypothetical protein